MADEFYTNLTVGDDVFAAAVIRKMNLALTDRGAGAILAHPVIAGSFMSANGIGALADGTAAIAFGADKMDAVAEGTGFTTKEIGSSKALVTPARRGLKRVVSDFARGLDSIGATALSNFVMDGIWSWQRSMVDLFCALFASITASVGSVAATLTWATIKAAASTLDAANAPGPYVCILDSQGWSELSSDALTLGGAIQMSPEQLEYMGRHGLKYKGRYLNGDADIYTSDEIDQSGGGYVQGMFGVGFMQWDTVNAMPSTSTDVIAWTPLYLIEAARNADKSEDAVVTSTNAGAGILQNAAGVKILSKVP